MQCHLKEEYDNFDLSGSHVIPALIRKMHDAKANNESRIEIWGTGSPVRDFLFVDDMVDACLYLMQTYEDTEPVNIGTGRQVSIKELAELIKVVTGYPGELHFDVSKPDEHPCGYWMRQGLKGPAGPAKWIWKRD